MPKPIAEKTFQVVMTSCWGWRKPLMAERDERKVTTMTSVTPGRISADRSPWKDLWYGNINAMKMSAGNAWGLWCNIRMFGRNQICILKTQVWDSTPWNSHDIVTLGHVSHAAFVPWVFVAFLARVSSITSGCRAALRRCLRCYNIGTVKKAIDVTERLQKSIHTDWLPLLNSPDKQIQIYIHFLHTSPCFGEVICLHT